jgi:hypothetical protein
VRLLSPERRDVYAEDNDDGDQGHRTYGDIRNQRMLENERTEIEQKIHQ